MLEPILKGLVEWLYGLMVDIMAYASGELLGVMSMDLTYFKTTAPVINDIVKVFVALGWALLIGNLVFQAMKAMVSGAGFEAEEPKILFFRTFIFSFLLLASRQICEIGLSITSKVITLLDMPASIEVKIPDESMFSLGGEAKWLLVIIVGIVLMVQMVKLLFEIGERYVITSVLTFFSPLAFSMGGSKNTSDIFKGWVRMYCSMLLMMVMNIVFLKLIMSAMSRLTSGGVLVWLVFVVALTRVARKIDSHIGKIGLSAAQTGNPISGSLPGMMAMTAVKVMTSTIGKSIAAGRGNSGRNGQGGRSETAGRRTGGRRMSQRPYRPSNPSGSLAASYGYAAGCGGGFTNLPENHLNADSSANHTAFAGGTVNTNNNNNGASGRYVNNTNHAGTKTAALNEGRENKPTSTFNGGSKLAGSTYMGGRNTENISAGKTNTKETPNAPKPFEIPKGTTGKSYHSHTAGESNAERERQLPNTNSGTVKHANLPGNTVATPNGDTLHGSEKGASPTRPSLPRNTASYNTQKSDTLPGGSPAASNGSDREIHKSSMTGGKSSEIQKNGITENRGGVREVSKGGVPENKVRETAKGGIPESRNSVRDSVKGSAPENRGSVREHVKSGASGSSIRETVNGGSSESRSNIRETSKGGMSERNNNVRETVKGGVQPGISNQKQALHMNGGVNYTENTGGSSSVQKNVTSGGGIPNTDSRLISGTNQSVASGNSKNDSHSYDMQKNEENKETRSDNYGESSFGERTTQYERDIAERGYAKYPEQMKAYERRENHEYKHGRYNPSAANKKSKQTYFQKDISAVGNEAEKERRRKRREDNGKHKR